VLTAGAAGLAAAAVAGCTGRVGGAAGTSSPTAPPPPDPLLAELTDEARLLAAYDATTARHPGLGRRLAGPRADHAAHAAALAQVLDAAGSHSPTPSGSATPPAARVPGTPVAALAALRAAERAAARARSAAALVAPAERAGLLAGVAASEATHDLVLR